MVVSNVCWVLVRLSFSSGLRAKNSASVIGFPLCNGMVNKPAGDAWSAKLSFAALESMGYAFTALLASGGSLSATVAVTLLRGIHSPMGHGTWAAILVGVLFRESTNRAI